jgi:PAS domain S-box-containing protein
LRLSAPDSDGVAGDQLGRIALDSLTSRICVLDSAGAIILTNHAWDQFARINAVHPERCGRGVNYLDICRKASGPFSELAAEAANGIEQVLHARTSHFILDYACPLPSRNAWFQLTARPLRYARGCAVISHRDNTAQVFAAEKLRRIQATYDVLTENPVDTTTVVAANGTIEYQIPATHGVFGYRPKELAGRNISDFAHPDDAESIRKLLRDCQRSPRSQHQAEFRFRNPDGSWRIVESAAKKLQTGPPGFVLVVSRDITRRMPAEKPNVAQDRAQLDQREEMALLAARLFREQEQERRALAVELHDELGWRFAGLARRTSHFQASAPLGAETLRHLQDSVAGLGHDLELLAQRIYPPMLDRLGLAVTLREYAKGFGAQHKMEVHFAHRGISARLDGAVGVALYRVAQSALDNVAQHAGTRQVRVALTQTAEGIRLAIQDRGTGFDPAQLAPGTALGIAEMRARLAAVHGSLSVRSRPGQGTAITALVPLTGENQPRAPVAGDVITP